MTYSVKEIYYTLQGEGAQSGRAAVFLRFAGCNLWSGLERDRDAATCRFCDTDFVGTDGPGGGKFADAGALARAVAAQWPPGRGGAQSKNFGAGGKPYVVCTGGEPLLQIDTAVIGALHDRGLEIGIETNGTLLPPAGLDWICVSPKAGAEQKLRRGDELKLIYPQEGALPDRFAGQDFRHFFLQPMDNENRVANIKAATAYCLAHPQWRLSLQTHKLIGIP
ncbi:MAG TPA: 7-carboxy-7-deazaguanine synthase [Rhizomicrobium sp.]|jgi:7-carboxy-7-deazaguanine synthase (Cx14CxxC type)|nr:7-carboxy-7-deazaguanine synthase [Rhizomicrobium sp.]